MTDFNWDEHPVEPSGPAFNWDAHPVEKGRDKINMQGDPLAAALVGNPLAQGVAHGIDTAKESLLDADAPTYKDYVQGAKGALNNDDPAVQAIKEKILARNMATVTGGLGVTPVAPLTSVASEAGGAIRGGLESMATGAGSKAEGLAAKAMGAERATIKKIGEDKIKEIGRHGLDQGIVSPMASAETMGARNEAVRSSAGKRMGDIYNQIDEKGASTFNPKDVAGKVQEQLDPLYRTPINKGEWSQLDNTIESIVARGKEPIPLTEAQALKEEIGSVAYPKGRKPIDATPKQQMAQDAYRIVNQAIDEATQAGSKAIGSEDLADALRAAKKQYGLSSYRGGAGELLDDRIAREKGNKGMGLTDWLALGAGGAGASHTGGASVPVALGVLGAKRGIEQYGPATAAVGLDKISKLIQSGSDALGKYGPALKKAAARGESALMTTHAMLLQDPEYRKTIEDIQ